ncbi:transporter substrate-binding domain-containing protein [Bradyrhizobium sp. CCBAU 53421]|uniref:transporter substrate-binding domain-containing protein n=1 Tax=Bradyrhizobium sp. CCBAU 53421 TaxID=1325120 RepID=UPI00188A8232|nr:transporter substrate-binding domain-containing protein [Bradyrhizobium sp. CCBAU 53421]QOZ36528.1 hypothetical protein XH92_37140 [Bradyrhizobium sp. CCBAU 53421]
MSGIQNRLLLAAVLASTFAASPAFAEIDNALLASIHKAGDVKVAMASQPPYMLISPSGEAQGTVLEIENMILKELGLPMIKPQLTAWSAMIPALQGRQVDFVADLAPTEERCKAVLFTAPIYVYRVALYVRSGNPKRLTGIAHLAQNPDIKVAMIDGSAQGAYALKNGVKQEQVVRVPDVQAGVATVLNGRADTYVESTTAVNHPEKMGLELVVDEQAPVSGASAAFRKEDVSFRDAFDEKRMALVKSGVVQKLYDKYGLSGGDAQAQMLAKVSKARDLVPSCQ